MNRIIQEMLRTLKEKKDFKKFCKIAIANKTILDNADRREKEMIAEAYNEYFYKTMPVEYKKNPHIHYEVRLKKE